METSKKSTGDEWSDLPLYAEGTLVSLSPRQVLAKVRKIIATCGRGYDKPLASYDPTTQSLKMSEGIFPLAERPSLPILPPSGMTRNGALFQQPAWEPIIDETESLSWPTPTTQDAKNNGAPSQMRRNSLPLNAAVVMWPTPKSTDHKAAVIWPIEKTKSRDMALRETIAELEPSAIGGKLNPRWVEWLMGFPDGWTDLEA